MPNGVYEATLTQAIHLENPEVTLAKGSVIEVRFRHHRPFAKTVTGQIDIAGKIVSFEVNKSEIHSLRRHVKQRHVK
jgi:hypothetical protein